MKQLDIAVSYIEIRPHLTIRSNRELIFVDSHIGFVERGWFGHSNDFRRTAMSSVSREKSRRQQVLERCSGKLKMLASPPRRSARYNDLKLYKDSLDPKNTK
jgi:hypothetical protein